MTADREFVSTTGTRHRLGQVELLGRYEQQVGSVVHWFTDCGRPARLPPLVVQQPVKDCKRCYPKGGG